MKTQIFAEEIEKLASFKMRAIESAALAIPGGVIGLAAARSQGKTKKFDEEDFGGMLAGSLLGAGLGFSAGGVGRYAAYSKRVKKFMGSKPEVKDGPAALAELTVAERPEWIRAQSKAIAKGDYSGDFMKGRLGGRAPEQFGRARVRAPQSERTHARSLSRTSKDVRSARRRIEWREAQHEAAKTDLDFVTMTTPNDYRAVSKARNALTRAEDDLRQARRGLRQQQDQANTIRQKLWKAQATSRETEGLVGKATRDLEKLRSSTDDLIKKTKSDTWSDVDKKYFGLF